ncbi:MAG: 2,3-bisphosphoglycerate-dependent phosphoglycerate mutase [Bacteriovoracaceae bacterium]|nr:2,3-bisphosphoglycerate-dependent phosphoglycerate mutase [Bacteriovoracaceae bacterium]
MKKCVFIRHGQSQWNLENRFTGWKNVELTDLGRKEAKNAGNILKKRHYSFDVVYTSTLTRAQDTAKIALQELNSNVKPIIDWRLNERHYGALTGKNKQETADQYGAEQVKIWRRSYPTRPPLMDEKAARELVTDKSIPLTLGESLEDTVKRVTPYWEQTISKDVQNGKSVLVVAHGNSLRALMKHLFRISDADILELEIPTGTPVECELDERLIGKKYSFLTE